MSLTKIYDQLAAEFREAGKYYGGGMQLPETVALSAYDDTIVFQAIKDTETPSEAFSGAPTVVLDAPKTQAALVSLVDRIRELNPDLIEAAETSDTVLIKAPTGPALEGQHVFPIRKKHHFDFFGTDRHHAMHAA